MKQRGANRSKTIGTALAASLFCLTMASVQPGYIRSDYYVEQSYAIRSDNIGEINVKIDGNQVMGAAGSARNAYYGARAETSAGDSIFAGIERRNGKYGFFYSAVDVYGRSLTKDSPLGNYYIPERFYANKINGIVEVDIRSEPGFVTVRVEREGSGKGICKTIEDGSNRLMTGVFPLGPGGTFTGVNERVIGKSGSMKADPIRYSIRVTPNAPYIASVAGFEVINNWEETDSLQEKNVGSAASEAFTNGRLSIRTDENSFIPEFKEAPTRYDSAPKFKQEPFTMAVEYAGQFLTAWILSFGAWSFVERALKRKKRHNGASPQSQE
jgi:hypothetical protein